MADKKITPKAAGAEKDAKDDSTQAATRVTRQRTRQVSRQRTRQVSRQRTR